MDMAYTTGIMSTPHPRPSYPKIQNMAKRAATAELYIPCACFYCTMLRYPPLEFLNIDRTLSFFSAEHAPGAYGTRRILAALTYPLLRSP